MKVIIVDDQKAGVADVKQMLVRHFPGFDICGIYNKMNEAIEGINNHQPDLVFLDVELDEEQTGFDLLEKITSRTFEVIFITAYNKFAARAFQYNAVHFIQKPIDSILFGQAVNRAMETKNMKDFTKRFDLLLSNVRTDYALPKKIMIPNLKGDGWLCLDVDRIVRIDSSGRLMVKITYEENGKYLYTAAGKSIGEAEKMFKEHNFIRVHESHLVNINHIELYKRNEKLLVMSDKTEVEVSRRNVNLLAEKIGRL